MRRRCDFRRRRDPGIVVLRRRRRRGGWTGRRAGRGLRRGRRFGWGRFIRRRAFAAVVRRIVVPGFIRAVVIRHAVRDKAVCLLKGPHCALREAAEMARDVAVIIAQRHKVLLQLPHRLAHRAQHDRAGRRRIDAFIVPGQQHIHHHLVHFARLLKVVILLKCQHGAAHRRVEFIRKCPAGLHQSVGIAHLKQLVLDIPDHLADVAHPVGQLLHQGASRCFLRKRARHHQAQHHHQSAKHPFHRVYLPAIVSLCLIIPPPSRILTVLRHFPPKTSLSLLAMVSWRPKGV